MNSTVSAAIEEAFGVSIAGWDFSWLRGRAHETAPPWDFGSLVRVAARRSRRALDIDTGGGEFIERLAPPSFLVATEGYVPNVDVAANRLAPLGIPVVQTASAPANVDQGDADPWPLGSPLPFNESAFDLVINRHSSYWPSEVFRVLRAGGRFLTQQRSEAGRDGEAWERLFGRTPHTHQRFDLEFAAPQLVRNGLVLARAEEADTPMVFRDLAGVVFYLRLVPWSVEDFDPNKDREVLEQIQRRLTTHGELRILGSHMLIECVKP
jgi:SAM-dependent methyltransferase